MAVELPLLVLEEPPDDRPPLRVMALHALQYCERLFYLEEVEELYVADDRVHAGRELHESLARAEEEFEHVQTLELSSESLGLRGKIDAAKRRDGAWVPYEHKRGKAKRGAGDEPVAWETDALQAAAYAMLLESHVGGAAPIAEARVRYHKDNVTVRVPIDDALRDKVRAAVARARALALTVDRPPVTSNENLCRGCSLAAVCLPEEARLADDPSREAKRLFPERDGRASLHVVSSGARVGRDGECLTVTPREGDVGKPTKHASRAVGAVLLHGFTQISTQALRLCADEDIAVHWLGPTGTHYGSLTATAGQVQRRIRQYRALVDDATRLRLAKLLVRARLEGQYKYLLRATRGGDGSRDPKVQGALDAIAIRGRELDAAPDVDVLRGLEGAAAREYWSCFNALLADGVDESLRFAGRSRRPPTDRLSAILNFGYGLLQTAVMRGVLAVGLEPAFGFYHTPRTAAHPLVLDLMELFRVPLWDMAVVGSLNRGQWNPSSDFTVTRPRAAGARPSSVWLSDDGRKRAIGLFEARLAESWKHPVVGYSLSYGRSIELEARLLEKEWSGEPGLFAQARLR